MTDDLGRSVTLIDSNILIDLFGKHPAWYEWSAQQLRLARAQGGLAINPIIYAEISLMFDSCEPIDALLAGVGIKVMSLENETSFLAGHVFAAYRKRAKQQTKSNVLPDFFIGAQAQTQGWDLLTRDTQRYKTYFPRVKLIAPT